MDKLKKLPLEQCDFFDKIVILGDEHLAQPLIEELLSLFIDNYDKKYVITNKHSSLNKYLNKKFNNISYDISLSNNLFLNDNTRPQKNSLLFLNEIQQLWKSSYLIKFLMISRHFGVKVIIRESSFRDLPPVIRKNCGLVFISTRSDVEYQLRIENIRIIDLKSAKSKSEFIVIKDHNDNLLEYSTKWYRNWNLPIKKRNLHLFHQYIIWIQGNFIFENKNISKKLLSYKDYLKLYWYLKQFFPKDIVNLILEKQFWYLFDNKYYVTDLITNNKV
jgi:hypothetical protein